MTQNTTSTPATKTYKQMAIELLNKKEPRFYIVNYNDEICDDTPFEYYRSLNNEQLAEVKAMLAECKKQDIEIWEYLDDKEVPEYLAAPKPGLYLAPKSIDLETAYVGCDIKMAIFYDGLSNAPEVIDTYIILSEEEYTSLLEWQLEHRRSGYNDLGQDNYELFKVVNGKARNKFSLDFCSPVSTPSFTIELTGIKADAIALCGEPDVEREIFFTSKDDFCEHSFLSIKDKKLLFFYEAMKGSEGMDFTTIDEVDAIAVEKTLAVEDYTGIVDAIKERFNGKDGFYRFIEFLDENNIGYTKKNR